jgi:hypothetical protein
LTVQLALIIGVWRGRQMEELLAQEVNRQLVDYLYDIWQRDRATKFCWRSRQDSNLRPSA